jgi:hypothetical protein
LQFGSWQQEILPTVDKSCSPLPYITLGWTEQSSVGKVFTFLHSHMLKVQQYVGMLILTGKMLVPVQGINSGSVTSFSSHENLTL